jgi:dihydrofolate synthase / folylpolyglutamate synthase
MHFDEAVQYLLGLGHETLTMKLGLRNTQLLLQALDHPERAFPAVQIAGTNGKGSTAIVLDSICRSAGIKTGLYTSPHLLSITERIKIDGLQISRADFARHATAVRSAATTLLANGQLEALPTFFEQVTAIALIAFREAGIELAILETGLGGRLDATSAVNAEVCAITQIALDHEEYLGSTIESITGEKAAIIRRGVSAVIAPQSPRALAVILRRCEEEGVNPLLAEYETVINQTTADGRFNITLETASDRYVKLWLGLRGRHQIENVAVAIQLAEVLRERGFTIPHGAIVKGVGTASHPGRLEIISDRPAFLLDGAHNPAGAQTLRDYLDEFGPRPMTLVFGAMRDKRIEQIAESLFPIANTLILTRIENPRAAAVETLLPLARRFANGEIVATVSSSEAVATALEKTVNSGLICITGSLYLIGETREQILNKHFFRKEQR